MHIYRFNIKKLASIPRVIKSETHIISDDQYKKY